MERFVDFPDAVCRQNRLVVDCGMLRGRQCYWTPSSRSSPSQPGAIWPGMSRIVAVSPSDAGKKRFISRPAAHYKEVGFPGKLGCNSRRHFDFLFSSCHRNPASQPWTPAIKSSNGVLSPRLFFSHRCFVALFGVLPGSIAKLSSRRL
jgi:hypothetical protein